MADREPCLHEPPDAAFEALVRRVEGWRAAGLRVVHCHGCFDPLHVGHLRHFKAARAFGDRLVVTLTADRFVRRQKGPQRPFFAEALRLELVEGLRVVDGAAINLWDTATATIAALRPHCFVKGEEYRARVLAGDPAIAAEQAAVRLHGGELVFTGGDVWSSTALMDLVTRQRAAESAEAGS